MLQVGAAHARAELDEIFVRVDDASFDDLGGAGVVATLVEGDPTPTHETVLFGLEKGETLHECELSYTPRAAAVKKGDLR